MNPTKTTADYAAIAIAPLLIFLMISSLANFLTLTLYHGAFPTRVSWILLMFTLGTVGIARVAIERDRTYSLGYAGVLGLVTFIAMSRFVDSPLFVVLILGMIAYLSDVIVRDCTLIDETVDASGQGLVDSGRLFVRKRIDSNQALESGDKADEGIQKVVSAQQPGRTVMYLALAALPLFGLGQFFLRSDADTWNRAQRLLALYLFSSLSLLVTTSFLGLRRYLRQRHVDMPSDVSIAWLLGGLLMIATVLMIAYMAPLPGQAIASFELPIQLDSPGNTLASRFGWGPEGADKSNAEAPRTLDQNSGKEEVGQTSAQGAPEGNVSEGNREKGSAGNQSGGKQSGASKSGPSPSQKGQSSQQQSSPQPSSKSNPASSTPSSSNESTPSESSSKEGQQNQSSQNQSSQNQSSQDPSDRGQSASKQSNGENQRPSQSPTPDPKSTNPTSQDESQSPESQQSRDGNDTSSDQSARQAERKGTSLERDSSRMQSADERPTPSTTSVIPMISGLIKLIVFLALAAVVLVFLWINRHFLRQWWESLFSRARADEAESMDEFLSAVTQVPPRAFGSFHNPIGKESDVRRVVVITFQAFEAWAREQGAPRSKDETPTEFLRRATKVAPQVSAPAAQIVDAYNRIVYGRGKPTDKDLQAAAQIWRVMQTT